MGPPGRGGEPENHGSLGEFRSCSPPTLPEASAWAAGCWGVEPGWRLGVSEGEPAPTSPSIPRAPTSPRRSPSRAGTGRRSVRRRPSKCSPASWSRKNAEGPLLTATVDGLKLVRHWQMCTTFPCLTLIWSFFFLGISFRKDPPTPYLLTAKTLNGAGWRYIFVLEWKREKQNRVNIKHRAVRLNLWFGPWEAEFSKVQM